MMMIEAHALFVHAYSLPRFCLINLGFGCWLMLYNGGVHRLYLIVDVGCVKLHDEHLLLNACCCFSKTLRLHRSIEHD
jgi:hypothetical protein